MIVLASQSASRRAMLDAAAVPYEAIAAEIDERAIEAELPDADPSQVAAALAEAKAQTIAQNHPDRWVLGSDSLVSVGDRRFDKPRSREDAANHLRYFSGREMHLHSAAAIVRDGRCQWRVADVAVLHVRDLSEGFIADYLAQEWPAVSGCVGVFRIEGRGVHLFDRIAGDHFTVLGMPLLPVLGALRKIGQLPS